MRNIYHPRISLQAKQSGFTLIELLVTLSISSILIASAAPVFSQILLNNRAVSLTNNLITALQIARSEAIKRNQDVTICKSSDSLTCSGSWSDGWIIFSDIDHDRQLDVLNGDTLIQVQKYAGIEFSISWNAFRSDNYIQYNAHGFIHSNNGTFKLCPPDNDVHYARAIIINRVGRARVSKDSDNDGVHEDSRGRALVC